MIIDVMLISGNVSSENFVNPIELTNISAEFPFLGLFSEINLICGFISEVV
jgi:hypothetical protein